VVAQGVCFSKREERYKIKGGKIYWTGEHEVWHWNNLTISAEKPSSEKTLLVVRGKKVTESTFIGGDVTLRYVLAFEVKQVHEPELKPPIDEDRDWSRDENRWVMRLRARPSSRYDWSDDYWIWEYAKKGKDIKSSYIWKLYREIQDKLKSTDVDKLFDAEDVSIGDDERVIPVIYQPSVDSLKNFLREVHCKKVNRVADGALRVEVSLLFNNEVLRKHSFYGILNKIYQEFRRHWYGRVFDIETFHIIVRKDTPEKFVFENIYSCDCHNMEDDNIHGDRKPAKERRIRYSFKNTNHPVVFINTSNHAMAQHDTNHRLWKWEYISWLKDKPVKLGSKSRKEIEQEFNPFFLKKIIDKTVNLIRGN
jgi:hypothetical protein